ncbi:MAG: MBL fold metallo-hydrolase [Candidatus Aminicenantes bacterium]|nr:MBL fold metallo-hydrolase [Candidatus Aminicenantes bacterium]
MKAKIISTALALATGTLYLSASVKLTILYDNTIHTPGTRSDWGFSCLVEKEGYSLLFDAGTQPSILAANAKKLGVDLSAIRHVMISHGHRDHFGGLQAVLRAASEGVTVYVPPKMPQAALQEISAAGGKVVPASSAVLPIPGMTSTGILGDGIPEQGLIIRTGKQNILITGCAHPGIVTIVGSARELVGGSIDVVVGGFHLSGHSAQAITGIIQDFRNLGVRRAGPTHCTGEKAIKAFRESYANDFVEMGVGQVLEFE